MIKRFGVLRTDPEVFYSTKGLAICKAIVRGASGNDVQIIAFGDVAESIGLDASKNDEISVTGYFKERVWEDHHGEKRSTTEFVVKSWEARK